MVRKSNKHDDPLKVGKFGIGFKSVFHITGRVLLKVGFSDNAIIHKMHALTFSQINLLINRICKVSVKFNTIKMPRIDKHKYHKTRAVRIRGLGFSY